MLIAALVVTLVGFILLVVALVVSSVAFAWACIGVCIVGFILLVLDIIRSRRTKGGFDETPDTDHGVHDAEADASADGGTGSMEDEAWSRADEDDAMPTAGGRHHEDTE